MLLSRSHRLRGLAAALVLLLMPPGALAEPAIVNADSTVYAAAAASSAALGGLREGMLVERVGVQDGWANITLNGRSGYLPESLLDIPGTAAEEALYTAEETPLYYAANALSLVLRTLPAGSAVGVKGSWGGWRWVTVGEDSGFIPAERLTAQAPLREDCIAYAARDGVPVYNGSGSVIRQVAVNTPVRVLEIREGLCRVTKDGGVAFMRTADLSCEPIRAAEDTAASVETFSPVTRYVKTEGAKVYNSKGDVVATLERNTKLSMSARCGALVKVSKDGRSAIMYESDLSETPVGGDGEVTVISPTTYYVATEGARVYDGQGQVTQTLSKNARVTVSAWNDTLMRVSVNGKSGYMAKGDLSAEPVSDAPEGLKEISPVAGWVLNDGAPVYDDDGQTLLTLKAGTAVVVSAWNASLARVTVNASQGWMRLGDLSREKPAGAALSYGDSGEEVAKLQARLKELGWYAGAAGGDFLDLTRAAVTAFQAAAGLTNTGAADADTLALLYSEDAPRANAEAEAETAPAIASGEPATGTAMEMDWWYSGIQTIFARGVTATITDVETGIAWREVRRGGTNHADCQPLAAEDTAKMLQACGGSWSWQRRAVFVTIGGVNYAASMNCQPHGDGAIKNNDFDGHHCIHFTNSRTAGSNRVDPLHRQAIARAARAVL